ncbi:hypothetical protein BHM03_00060499 [Ensete ventricosum]|nr:hypothetical protein BHM03_00060499 [Ensete ventricosum]
MRRCYAPLAAASACDLVLLPSSDSPYGLAVPPHVATWSASPPTTAVPIGGRRCGWASRCKRSPLRASRSRRLPLQGALAIGNHPLAGG